MRGTATSPPLQVASMFWYLCGPKKSNFGDLVGPWLYAKIKGKPPRHVKDARAYKGNELLVTCGSVLQQWNMRSNWVVWGSGIYRNTERFPIKPKRVCAVRGPLTRALLLKNGIACPEVYGDPALLIPRFYKAKRNAHQYRVGLLPHVSGYTATKRLIADAGRTAEILVIDVDRPVEQVCDDIASCEATLSGSLHGIIVSHAFGIPCAWSKRMGLEGRPQDRGDGIKYLDYYASLGIDNASPLELPTLVHKPIDELIDDVVRQFPQPEDGTGLPNLDLLLQQCPF